VRRRTRWPALLAAGFLAVGTSSCVDGLPTDVVAAAADIPVHFAVAAAARLSGDEQDALSQAFDRLDRIRIRLFRQGETDPFLDTLVLVQPGQDEYAIELSISGEDAEQPLSLDLTGAVGEVELFGTSVTVTVRASRDSSAPGASDEIIQVPIRYTGPGLRGLVLDPDGRPATNLAVDLLSGGSVIQSNVTSAEGEYLFVDLQSGSYVVRVETAAGLVSCPAQREIGPIEEESKIVAGFKLSRTNCELTVLVLSGGDVDDTGDVISALAGRLPEGSFASSFVVVSPPSLDALLDYDVVLLFENGSYEHARTVGDRIAEYVGAGGNLVIGSFYWQNRSDGGYGNAGWGALEGLDPFSSTGGARYGPGSLGSLTPHPVTDGVSAVSVPRWWGGVGAKGGTQVVASWADGTPLAGVATRAGGQRMVGISAFPGLSGGSPGLAALYANALRWAGGAGGPSRVSTVRGLSR
jgi:hypothetical protein